MNRQRWLSILTYSLTTMIGIGAFLYPFWLPALAQSADQQMAHAGDSALMLTLLVGLCLAVLLLEVQSQGVSAKAVALLGVLVAINAVLRFAEAAVPGPGGFSPIFPLIILGGYVLGARFGFLLGVLTLLVSAILTGGVGPWLPYQMLAAGFVGLFAGLLPPASGRAEIWLLAGYGIVSAFAYGWVMDFAFWPFGVGNDTGISFDPALGPLQNLHRFVLYNIATSMGWNLGRALTNAVLIVLVGPALLRLLRRSARPAEFTPGFEPSQQGPERTE